MKDAEKYSKSVQFWAKIYLVIVTILHNYIWYLVYLHFLKGYEIHCLVGNSILGALMLEWAWYNT